MKKWIDVRFWIGLIAGLIVGLMLLFMWQLIF